MKKAILFFLLSTTFFQLSAQKAVDIPLINREIFFDNPEIAGGQLSPDAQWISFIKAYKGTMNVWVKKADEPFEKGRPITADTLRPVFNYFWSFDSKYLLFVQDKGGNENFHVYAVNPADAVDAKTGVPNAKDLTPIEGARAQSFVQPLPPAG